MFSLDTKAATSFDKRGGFINESGKYKGTIESAVWHVKEGEKGRSEGIFLSFVSDTGERAKFYINTLYHGATANEFGIKTVHALLACLRLRSSGEIVPCELKEYNRDTQQLESVYRNCFTALHGKRIGLVVQMVHEDGQEHPAPNIYTIFEADTEFTASEVLGKALQPQQLAKAAQYIANNPLRDKRKNKPAQSTPPAPQKQFTPADYAAKKIAEPREEIADDIPF